MRKKPESAEPTPTVNWSAVLNGATISEGVGIQTPAVLALSLNDHLRQTYPINKVPQELVDLANKVDVAAVTMVREVRAFAEAMQVACGQDKPADDDHTHYSYGPKDLTVGLLCGDRVTAKTKHVRVGDDPDADVDCPGCVTNYAESRDRG